VGMSKEGRLSWARRAMEEKPASIRSNDCTHYRNYDPASRTYRAYSSPLPALKIARR